MRQTIVIALLALAGCGGGSEPATSPEQDAQSAATPAASGNLAVTLDWVPPTRNEDSSALLDLRGYTIYGWLNGEKIASATWHLNNPGLSAYVVDFPSGGDWLIGMTAVNSKGKESGLSNTVALTL
jgi:hypothetical protein